ncbi:MAG: HipA domain-containing protein [Rectinemataceae bacterium]|nr:HipA domain-containing protein [Rectinemataceae bacterium]
MSGSVRRIEVFADWAGLGKAGKMGTLSAIPSRGKEVFSFDYEKEWLLREDGRVLDPELRLFKGPQYPAIDKPNFGIFLDSSPDRWGRVLMRRREGIHARKEGRGVRTLAESDYLLGVYDENRMGALRFREIGSPVFQSSDTAMAAPPWARLRDLEYASHIVESDVSDDELDPWLALLIAPGSSLGGARPKASVVDSDRSLWIAKFPGKDDDRDVGVWEMLVATLARNAGIVTSECRLESLSSRGSTFLTRRFDRVDPAKRIHFASAMTMLGRKDGDDSSAGASYLEIADFLIRNGASPDEDLGQLWRRIVFSIAISNTDDHLRNHGFLLGQRGWRLSPAYDLNPSPFGGGLSLCIDENDNALDFDLALSVARYFRLDAREARSIRESVVASVSRWRELAEELGISRTEQEKMAGAFASP